MCRVREQEFCVALGEDSSRWSKHCPLELPTFFYDAVKNFTLAIDELVKGNRKESLEALRKCNSEAIGSFYIEHGQQSAYFRVSNWRQIRKENQYKKKFNLSPRNPTPKKSQEVFERDFYRCRYCSLPIIKANVFSEYSRIVGSDNFPNKRKNTERNGITLGLRGVADHVEPYASGAGTEMDNLVTSCYSCNFGKAGYTLEQIGIFDPRLKQPVNDGWLGLTEFLPTLRAMK